MSETDETPDDGPGDDDGAEIEVGPDDDPHAADRLMMESCWSIVSTRYDEPFANTGVQQSYERMLIAAMERIARICRNDLPHDEP